MEEDAEGIGLHGAVERGSRGQTQLPYAGDQSGDHARQREEADRLASHPGRHHGLDEHDEDAGDGEQQFRQNAIRPNDWGHLVHCFTAMCTRAAR